MIHLTEITLFGIDAHDPKGIKRAAEICQREIKFGAVRIITDRLFWGREAYSRFCIERMNEFVNTSHVLIVHPDGYIQDPKAWNNDWLQYDYIGAVWDFHNKDQVGNGGFSLRSKKLLNILSKIDCDKYEVHPEDDFICRQIKQWLIKEHGIKFAPVEVAKLFSIEAYSIIPPYNRYNGEFGFHGKWVTGLNIPINEAPKRKFGAAYQKTRLW